MTSHHLFNPLKFRCLYAFEPLFQLKKALVDWLRAGRSGHSFVLLFLINYDYSLLQVEKAVGFRAVVVRDILVLHAVLACCGVLRAFDFYRRGQETVSVVSLLVAEQGIDIVHGRQGSVGVQERPRRRRIVLNGSLDSQYCPRAYGSLEARLTRITALRFPL